jgi:hypothetical protein
MLLAGVLIVGCRGETVVPALADTGTSDTSQVIADVDVDSFVATDATTPADASCEPRSGNLLRDPSFEDLAPVDGGFESSGWGGYKFDRTSMAAHCSYAAILTDQGGNGPAQYRVLPIKLPIGGRVRVRLRARWIAGPKNEPGIVLYLIQGTVSGGTYFNRGSPMTVFNGDGAWYEHVDTLTNDTGGVIDSFGFAITMNATSPQTLAIDDTELTIVDDGG